MKKVKKIFFIALMILIVYSINSYAYTGSISTEGARIRREPNTESEVLTIAYNGETVEILEKSGQWYQVKYGEYTGYIREDLLQVENTERLTENEINEENQNETIEEETELNNNQESEKQILSNTHIRLIPSICASSVGEIKAGDKVTVVEIKNLWSCINYQNKKVWLPSDMLTNVVEEKPITETQKQPQTQIGYINVEAAIIRKGASTSAEIITERPLNTQLEIISEEGDWYKINFNGQEAYIAKRLVSDSVTQTSRSMRREDSMENTMQEEIIEKEQQKNSENVATEEINTSAENESNTSGKEIVDYAMQYLGYAYVYGGAGPTSFDCSGFTQYVYKQFGINLSHSAVTQSNNGIYITKQNLQLGDLVIFRDWDNLSIGHCGIYVGDGEFIHAANAKRGVVIDTLNSGYYYERYVSGRRLLTN